MQSEVKPCPFCGSKARRDMIEHDERTTVAIVCVNSSCGAHVAPYDGLSRNINSAWNRRAAISDQERAVEADTGTFRTHIGKSTANDCWFVRVYPCLSENDARAVQSRIRSALVDVPVEPVQMHRTRHKISELAGWSDWSKWEEGFGQTNDPTFEIEIENRKFYTSPPPHRDGEDSAEVNDKARTLATAILQNFGAMEDGNGEEAPELSMARDLLAATRSGSATDHSGGDHG